MNVEPKHMGKKELSLVIVRRCAGIHVAGLGKIMKMPFRIADPKI
jgi:hypothetical protein